MNTTMTRTLFTGGEWTDSLWGRLDREDYATAFKKMENFFSLPQGGFVNRAGSKFLAYPKDKDSDIRYIKFRFSTEQVYMLIFGNQYMWIGRDGGLVVESDLTITNATKASPVVVTSNGHGLSNGDWFFINDVQGMTELNGKQYIASNVTANTIELHDTLGVDVDGSAYTTYVSGGAIQKIVEISTPYVTADLPTLSYAQSADILYLNHKNYEPRTLTRTSHTSWTLATQNITNGPFANRNADDITLTPSVLEWASGVSKSIDDVVYVDETPLNFNASSSAQDLGGLVLLFASAVHGLSGQDEIEISGTVNYDGRYFLNVNTEPTGSTFYIFAAYVPETFTGSETITRRRYFRSKTNHTTGAGNPTPPGNTTDWIETKLITGTNITLTSSSAYFVSNQVGALIKLFYVSNYFGKQGKFTANGRSEAIPIKGAWKATTSGTWDALFEVQRSTDLGKTWETEAFSKSESNLNRALTGFETEPGILYRVTCTGYTTGTLNWTLVPANPEICSIVQITGYTSSTVVTVKAINPIHRAQSTDSWSEGMWSNYRGWPNFVTLYDQRVLYARTNNAPSTWVATEINDFDSMDTNEPPLDTDSYKFAVETGGVNEIKWITSYKSLLLGTSDGVYEAQKTDLKPISSVNPPVMRTINSQSMSDLSPLKVDTNVAYVESGTSRIQILMYDNEDTIVNQEELSILASHLFEYDTISNWTYQRHPNSLIWAVLSDGKMISITIYPKHNVFSFSRHTTGATGKYKQIESLHRDNGVDELWMLTQRTINGQTRRYIEIGQPRLSKYNPRDAFFVDCGLSYDSPIAVTGVSQANPVVITATSHGFINGDRITIDEIEGPTNLNNQYYLVANKTTNTFEITDLSGNNIDGTSFTVYSSGGFVRLCKTTVSNLDHLEGQSVSVLADGKIVKNITVSSGSITIPNAAGRIHVGIGYNSDAEPMDFDGIANDGTNLIIKNKTINGCYFSVKDSMGFKAGPDANNLNKVLLRKVTDNLGPVSLFTGDSNRSVFDNSDPNKATCYIRNEDPVPVTINKITADIVYGDQSS